MNSNEKQILQQVKELQETGNHQGAADIILELLKIVPNAPALWTYYGGILSELQ